MKIISNARAPVRRAFFDSQAAAKFFGTRGRNRFAGQRVDARRVIAFYEQQLGIIREIGDRRGEENVPANLGFAYKTPGDMDGAMELWRAALAI